MHLIFSFNCKKSGLPNQDTGIQQLSRFWIRLNFGYVAPKMQRSYLIQPQHDIPASHKWPKSNSQCWSRLEILLEN
jgi:hypothetical protein